MPNAMKCKNCGNHIHRWDNNVWYHLVMGQVECSMSNPDVKAAPEETNENTSVDSAHRQQTPLR